MEFTRPYRGQDAHTVELFDRQWALPLVDVSADTYIASNAHLVLGTTEFVEAAASALADRLAGPDVDYLVTPEAKSLPLTQALARELDVEYVVVRKSVKAYMHNPVTISVDSITTDEDQSLVLDGSDADRLAGARVALVDDAVSTGGTMDSLASLLDAVDADVDVRAAVFAEGREHPDVETLATLPLFVAE
ncbi:phosphoribosyltransferase family protein [Halarchaeum sp. P4]|uniref:phosphoribosyltransferase family protein n=1 Tax=Halarchaeum sp. P4 TaxID=3421639 RepID=UPI003EBB8753